MTNLERKIEEDSIKYQLEEINSMIIDKTLELEMLKATKAMAENAIEFRRTLN